MDSQSVTVLTPSVARREEIPALTGLRFLAALSVAVAHGASISFRVENASPAFSALKFWMEVGAGFGMALFFVLSGFVIHYNYSTVIRSGGIRGFAQFLWARFSRLYPLFAVVLIADIMFGDKLYLALVGAQGGSFRSSLSALPYYLTFTQSWFYIVIDTHTVIYQIGNVAPVMWSISTEWFFYLCYPVIMFGAIRATKPSYAIAAAVAWSLAWGGFAYALGGYWDEIDAWAITNFGPVAALQGGINQDSFIRWLGYFSPFMRIGEFILGCLSAQAYMVLAGRDVGRLENILSPVLLAVAALSVPAILYLMYAPGGTSSLRRLNMNFGLGPSIALLLFCAARYRPRALRIFEARAMIKLGDASYSIYLIHLMVFAVLLKGLHAPLPDGIGSIVFVMARLVMMLALVLLLSVALFAYGEDPARRTLSQLWNRPRGLLTPGVVALAPFACAGLVIGGAHLATRYQQWKIENASGIMVTLATYGGNCGVDGGNATSRVRAVCDGQSDCDFVVDVSKLGDVAPGCGKGFAVEFLCTPDKTPRTVELPGEAGFMSVARLRCGSEPIAK